MLGHDHPARPAPLSGRPGLTSRPGQVATEAHLLLVLNAGSSSLKASVIEPGQRVPRAQATIDWGYDATRVADHRATVDKALADLERDGVRRADIAAAGHRVVHGGLEFRVPTLIDDTVLDQLARLVTLAPLHNAVAAETIRAQHEVLPNVPMVACFDTAFHATLPPAAYVYPLPWSWHADWGIRRFGFHGLSVEWSVRRAAELLARPAAELCLVVAHLGSGCSATAVEAGRSMATSMGLTPMEGLMMGTRSGSFDPGIVLEVMRLHGLDADALETAIEHESGLLGVSGSSGDMREIERAASAGDERAQLAFEIFVRRAAEGIAAAAAALPRLDGLVFTGGIGEHSAAARRGIADRLAVLGVDAMDAAPADTDGILSRAGAAVAVLRVEAREDLVIAEATADLLWREPQ